MTMPSFPIDPAADREPNRHDEPPTLAETEGDDPIVEEFDESEGDDGLEPQAQVPPLN